MKRVVLIGSRDLAGQMARHFARDPDLRVAGFLDDFRPAGDATPWGPVLGGSGRAEALVREGACDAVAVGVGYKHLEARGRILAALDGRVPLLAWAHPTAWVDPDARLAAGTFLSPGCVVDAAASIGLGTFLNLACTVSHDSSVGRNCFLGPGVTIAGFVEVGEGCFLGAGTIVIDNVRLAPGVTTGAGAVVTQSLAEPGLYVGVPARRVR